MGWTSLFLCHRPFQDPQTCTSHEILGVFDFEFSFAKMYRSPREHICRNRQDIIQLTELTRTELTEPTKLVFLKEMVNDIWVLSVPGAFGHVSNSMWVEFFFFNWWRKMRLKNTERELVAWRVELACEPRCLISNPFPLRPLHLGALWNMSFERVEDNFLFNKWIVFLFSYLTWEYFSGEQRGHCVISPQFQSVRAWNLRAT